LLIKLNGGTIIKKLWEIFIIFFKIGAFTFGGGYAMISIIHNEIVQSRKWIDDDEMLDIIAISEATPGVISINTATFVGYKVAGFWGSFFATLGTVIPSVIIIVLVTLFFIPYMSNRWIQYAFEGIRAGVIVLIFNAAIKLNKVNKKCAFNFILTGLAFLIASFTSLNVIYILLGGLAVGIIYNLFINKSLMEDKK